MRRALLIPLLIFASCAGGPPWPGPAPAAGDWLQEGGGPQRTCVASSILVPPLTLAWTASLSAELHRGSALAADGTVLVPTVRGDVDVVDCMTGETLLTLGADGVLTGTPALSGSLIFVPYGGPWGDIACWDLSTEELQWSAITKSLESALLLSDSAVYAVSYEGRVYRFGLRDSVEVWHADMPGNGYAGPCLADSVLICVCGSGDIFGYSPADGVERWRIPTGSAIMAAPVTDGRVAVAANREGDCYAVHTADGALRWKRSFGVPAYAPPALHGDDLYLALSDGSVRCLSLDDARQKWKADAGGIVSCGPVIAGDVLVVCAQNGTVTIFDRHGGRVLWRESVGERIPSSPLVYRGRLYVCGESGQLFCFTPGEKP
jgi:outer membrane protein assembly factor BamB